MCIRDSLGAGTGFISLGIAKKANIVFSLDSSKNMLKELYSSAKENEINNIYPIKGELENLPLFDDSIDLIFMNMALHHVANPDKAIKEMNSCLLYTSLRITIYNHMTINNKRGWGKGIQFKEDRVMIH